MAEPAAMNNGTNPPPTNRASFFSRPCCWDRGYHILDGKRIPCPVCDRRNHRWSRFEDAPAKDLTKRGTLRKADRTPRA